MNPCKVLTQPPASCEHHHHSSAAWAPPNHALDQRGPSLLFFPASYEISGVPVCCQGLEQEVEEEEDSGGGERSRETSDETCFLPHLQGLERCPAHSRCTAALWTELGGLSLSCGGGTYPLPLQASLSGSQWKQDLESDSVSPSRAWGPASPIGKRALFECSARTKTILSELLLKQLCGCRDRPGPWPALRG